MSDLSSAWADRPDDLAVDNIDVVYEGVFAAVHGVSLRVPTGAVVGLLGSNGAGKSSVMRAVAGFLRSERAQVTAGSIRYRDVRIDGRAPHWVARRGVVLVPERDKVFAGLTVSENLEIGSAGGRRKSSGSEVLESIYEYFPILFERGQQKAGYLSGGERQMLGIARALMRRPSLLMIDEVSLGLAPKIVEDLIAIMRRINEEQGTTILFVEQNATAAFEAAQYVYIMESGRVALEGTPADLRGRADVQELYLGIGGHDRPVYGAAAAVSTSNRWWG